jgi:branched-chain amino acid transport system substrate-binding protein
MNYYAMWVLKEALELSGKLFPKDPLKPDNLREAFLKLEITSGPAVDTFPSASIRFNGTGDNPDAKAVVMQVLDGQTRVVWPFETAQAQAVFPRPDASKY